MRGQVFKLILLALSLISCPICSNTYSEGQLKLTARPYSSNSTNGSEIAVGKILDIKVENITSSFYAPSCFTASDESWIVRVVIQPIGRSEFVQVKGLAPGQAKITITCTGDASGEYALCNSIFKDTGSITITVTEPTTKTRASKQFSDSSIIPTSF